MEQKESEEKPIMVRKYCEKWVLLSEGCGCCSDEIKITKKSVEELVVYLEDQLETCSYLLDCVVNDYNTKERIE